MDTPQTPLPPELLRYRPQILFRELGREGQLRLRAARVTLIGCGALGSALAGTLVRAGVGWLRIIDRDFVELDNLQRQVLFDEQDVADALPKAEAAARKLRRINSDVRIEPVVADLHASNALSLCEGADLLLDGADNLETRFLVNDVAVKTDRPWVYGACIGAEGRVLPIQPRRTPCLRCLWPEPPPPGSIETCDTAGILAPAVQAVAALQSAAAIQVLAGVAGPQTPGLTPARLLSIDVWRGRFQSVDVQAAFVPGACECCGKRRFEFLEGGAGAATTALCGRNAVQLLPPAGMRMDLDALAARLSAASLSASLFRNAFLLRANIDRYTLTVFPDGRAIVQGTSDPAEARSVMARWVGC